MPTNILKKKVIPPNSLNPRDGEHLNPLQFMVICLSDLLIEIMFLYVLT